MGVGGDRESRDSGGGKGAPNPTRPGHPSSCSLPSPNPPSPRSLLYPRRLVSKKPLAQRGRPGTRATPTLHNKGLSEGCA